MADAMLGRLARWLRLMGYDAPLLTRLPVRIMPNEMLLTRRQSLAGRPGVFLVTHDKLEDQLDQVITEFKLAPDPARFFSRCLDCNLPVESIGRERAAGLVPDHVLNTAHEFSHCPNCGKVFWPGSHGQRALVRLAKVLPPSQPPGE